MVKINVHNGAALLLNYGNQKPGTKNREPKTATKIE